MEKNRELILPTAAFIYKRFLRQGYGLLLTIGLVVLLSAAGSVLVPYLMSRLVDGLGGPSMTTALALGFVGYAAALGLTRALGQWVSFLSYIAAENLNFIAATAFFERLVRKTSTFFIEHNPVEIQTARDRGQHAIYVVVQLGLIVFLPGLLQVGLSLALLGVVIDVSIVAIVLGYGAVFIAGTYAANTWTRKYLDRAVEAAQENARFVGSAINAMETLRYFNGDRWARDTFGAKTEEVRTAWTNWAVRRLATAALFGLALAVQMALAFLLTLPRYYAGELSLGDIILVHTLLLQLNQPFEMFGAAIDDIVRSWTGFVPFAKIWNAPEEPDVAAERPFALSQGRLEFSGVTFGYGEEPTISDISFVAERGRLNFIVGETGAGKSTLFKLALKSVEPQEGTILVDGSDLSQISRRQWYGAIGVVPQEILLLNDTIALNITLGRTLDAERLRATARRASILPFIEALPDGFDTNVGERGLKLSGGERQRIAIARALYDNPQILFLDEASSALDEQTEKAIIAELRGLADSVTVVAITHRKTMIGSKDAVLELLGRS